MADTAKYGMGQLRYVSSSSYMTKQNFETQPIKTLVTSSSDSEEGTGTEFYQDVYLSGGGSFNFATGVPYLLHLDIPKDLSYDCIYQIKMIATPGLTIDTSKLAYQMIKYITVPKAVGIGNTSRIILYPVTDSAGTPGIREDGTYDLKVAIAKTLNNNPVIGDIIFDESMGKYYIYDGSVSDDSPIIGSSVEILNKNDTVMEHTWATSDIITEAVGFDIIFTPRSSNATYNGILIQMQRNALDYDIYSETSDGGIYGRKIDISSSSNWNAEVYQLTNLIDNNSVPTPLTNIGVYSHPNLLMAINGEEIRVGQSGYYELNDFEITSLAIAANDVNDKFTLDYQYKTTS